MTGPIAKAVYCCGCTSEVQARLTSGAEDRQRPATGAVPMNRSPVGEKSLEWLRSNVPAFAIAEAAAKRAEAEQQANREKMEKPS